MTQSKLFSHEQRQSILTKQQKHICIIRHQMTRRFDVSRQFLMQLRFSSDFLIKNLNQFQNKVKKILKIYHKVKKFVIMVANKFCEL